MNFLTWVTMERLAHWGKRWELAVIPLYLSRNWAFAIIRKRKDGGGDEQG